MPTNAKPLAIYHEHPDWFRPLFAELDRRGLAHVRLDPRTYVFDPAESTAPYRLTFNRMSPSAHLRGGGHAILSTVSLLDHWERLGIPVVNGSRVYQYEISKARQSVLLEKLNLPHPRTRIINDPLSAMAAADGLRFPVVVKPNVGGSGAGIVRFDRRADLAAAVNEGRINLGIDHTGLVQEFVPARGGHITRVEVLGGKFLYAINIYTTGDSFNLCPADICQRSDGVELVRTACPIDAPRSGLKVEATKPTPAIVAACERIARAIGLDVGGIEYMIDDRDGGTVFYDINALSNFVADAVNVVGFDPHARLVDYLEFRAETIDGGA